MVAGVNINLKLNDYRTRNSIQIKHVHKNKILYKVIQ